MLFLLCWFCLLPDYQPRARSESTTAVRHGVNTATSLFRSINDFLFKPKCSVIFWIVLYNKLFIEVHTVNRFKFIYDEFRRSNRIILIHGSIRPGLHADVASCSVGLYPSQNTWQRRLVSRRLFL